MKITDTLIIATIFSLPLYLVKVEIFNIPTNLFEILALIAILSFFASKRIFTESLVSFYKKNVNFILLATLFFLSLLISYLFNNPGLRGLGIIKSWFIVPFIFGLILYFWIQSERDIKKILYSLYFSTFIISLAGIVLFLMGHLTYDFRLRGPYLSPNHLSMYLAPGLLMGPYLASNKLPFLFNKFYYLVSTLFIATAFFLTKSYTAAIAVLVAFAVYYKFEKKSKLFFKKTLPYLLVSFFILTLLTANKVEYLILTEKNSFTARTEIWKVSAKIIENNPILGVGPGKFQERYLEYQKFFQPYQEWAVPHPHNIFLSFWLQSGIISLISFIGICLFSLINLFSKIKKGSELALVIFIVILYTILHGLFDTTYWKNDLSMIFWIFIFASLKLKDLKKL